MPGSSSRRQGKPRYSIPEIDHGCRAVLANIAGLGIVAAVEEFQLGGES
jgi:hypothetical protein